MSGEGLDEAPTTIWQIIRDAQADPGKVPCAIRWIIDTYGPRIRGYVGRKLRGNEDAVEEVVQDVFVTLVQPGFVLGLERRPSLRRLLKVIAFRRVKDFQRGIFRRKLVHCGPLEDRFAAPEDEEEGAALDRRWVEEVVAEAIRGLDPLDRALWEIVAAGGSNEDIARRFEITRGAAAKRAFDARARMRRRVRAIISREFLEEPRPEDVELELDELGVDRILDALTARRDRD